MIDGEFYSVEAAAKHAAEWCKKHPAWMRICDLEDTARYYVQWQELDERKREFWGSEHAYNEWASKRQKVKTGFISGKGEFFADILDVPRWHNSMMVFCVGVKAAQELRDGRVKAWLSASQPWDVFYFSLPNFASNRKQLLRRWGVTSPPQTDQMERASCISRK